MFRSIRHRLALFTYSWHAIGPASMLRNSVRWSADAEARAVDSGFDARYGTDTNADLTPGEADILIDRHHAATMYLPTMDQDLAAMLAALPWPESLRRDATFIDLGSGKARVVLLAAMQRFRQIVGVELSPRLHLAAVRNVERVRDAGALVSPVRLVHGDATAFDAPPGPLVTYLYHPFREPIAALVMDRLVASLEASPRPAAILYCHPALQPGFHPSVFGQRDVFQLAVEGGRQTRGFLLGWSVWTNDAWLDRTTIPVPLVSGAGEA